jgi:hypothetical protein
VRFVITSGTGIGKIIDQRPDARSAHQHALRLISFKRPAIRVFDADTAIASVWKSCADQQLRKRCGPEKGSKAPAGV